MENGVRDAETLPALLAQQIFNRAIAPTKSGYGGNSGDLGYGRDGRNLRYRLDRRYLWDWWDWPTACASGVCDSVTSHVPQPTVGYSAYLLTGIVVQIFSVKLPHSPPVPSVQNPVLIDVVGRFSLSIVQIHCSLLDCSYRS